MQIIQSVARPKTLRRNRSPQYRAYIHHRPWVIQPFMLAPVLAGDTLTNVAWQARAVSDPVRNPLTGATLEHHFFYYGFSGLVSIFDQLKELMLDPAATAESLGIASTVADPKNFFIPEGQANRVNWLAHIMPQLVEDYFRDEGELAGSFQYSAGQYFSTMRAPGWAQSAFDSAVIETPTDPSLAVGGDGSISGSEVEALLAQWALQRQAGMTALSYEEWLQREGVSQPAAQVETRERIRSTYEWTYPSNTVDPTNGTPRSAWSWSVQARGDKNRFFKEPGFIVGVSIVRPKVYFARQNSVAASMMSDPYRWLPSVLGDDLSRRIIRTAPAGLLETTADEVVFDIGDLLLYGDQFFDVKAAAGDGSITQPAWRVPVVNGVDAAGTSTKYGKYPTNSDALFPFVGNDTAAFIKQDLSVDLSITSRIQDLTP